MENQYLVVADMDKIQGYIFASQRMREVRGASYIVGVTSSEKTIELLKTYGKGNHVSGTTFNPALSFKNDGLAWKGIYCAGGALKVQFESKAKAEEFIQALEKLFKEETISGSITAVAVPIDGSSYAELIENAEIELRYAKDGKSESLQLNNSSFHRRCMSCGAVPAVKFDESDPSDLQFICNACIKKRSIQKRLPIYNQIQTAIRKTFNQNVVLELPDDFSKIAEMSSPENYMGFIDADGNRMGEKMRLIQYPNDSTEADKLYSLFSNAIIDITEKALIEAVIEAFESDIQTALKKGEKLMLPVEVVILGGDDLVMVTTADKALPIAQSFCANFHNATQNADDIPETIRSDGGISMSAGVVLAKQKFPFLTYYRLADELLKSAKKRSRKEKKANAETEVSALDFMVVSEAAVRPLKEVREVILKEEERFRDRNLANELLLTARPYTVDEFSKLLNHIRALHQAGFPNNKLKTFRDLLRRGRYQSIVEYALLKQKFGVNQTKPDLEALREEALSDHERLMRALLRFEKDFMTEGTEPWKCLSKEERKYTSSIFDLVEIYEFVR